MPAKKVSSEVVAPKKPSLASLVSEKNRQNPAVTKRAVKRIAEASAKNNQIKIKAASKVRQAAATKVRKKKADDAAAAKEVVLTLPTNMSIRAREKALAILSEVSKDFVLPAQRVAITAGLCFILIGATCALSFGGAIKTTSQSAALISAGETTKALLEHQNPRPTFSLKDALPIEAVSASTHRIVVSEAHHVDVTLFSLSSGKQTNLQVDDLKDEEYEFSIDPAQLEPGTFVVKAFVETPLNEYYSFEIGTFIVPAAAASPQVKEYEAAFIEDIDSTQEAEATSTESEEPAVVASLVEENSVSLSPLALTLSSGQLTAQTVITARAPEDASFVEFYLRPISSINLRFIGSAQKRQSEWYFFFDTTEVPNGTYELIGRSWSEGSFIESETTAVQIANYVQPPTLASSTAAIEISSTTPRSFPDFSPQDITDFASSSLQLNLEMEETIDAIFAEYREPLRTQLNRYAVAEQSKNAVLIAVARRELFAVKDQFVAKIISNPIVNHVADNLDQELTRRFEDLQKRVQTFEELRRTASADQTSTDDDMDGISNFDELNIFNTDAKNPDSDYDGVIDGIEVVRGFNPLSQYAETTVSYELPQQSFDTEFTDVLSVGSVAPFVATDAEGKSTQGLYVSGTALPNAYVTLYIFSTPMIVTVRADQDGTYRYLLEKELENGQHAVYAALTDNNGSLVAKSASLSFVKDGAVIAVADSQETIFSSREQTMTHLAESVYVRIIGVALLGFGIVLLLLALGLRQRNPEIATPPRV